MYEENRCDPKPINHMSLLGQLSEQIPPDELPRRFIMGLSLEPAGRPH